MDSGNEEVHCRGVSNLNDEPLDLIIRVKDNAPYQKNNKINNGFVIDNSTIGKVNLKSDKATELFFVFFFFLFFSFFSFFSFFFFLFLIFSFFSLFFFSSFSFFFLFCSFLSFYFILLLFFFF